jgi:carboxypeptidase C (cathepsin A)
MFFTNLKVAAAVLVFGGSLLFGQGTPAAAPKPATPAPAPAPPKEEAPSVTQHSITLNGKPLNYTVTTGMMPIRTDSGELEANIFFIAYTVDSPGRTRPLTFSFNGGPGSSSVWLHLGALGPKRVQMNDDGSLPPAPYKLIDNPQTWLDQTDLVFIDPVGTGYSRAVNPDVAKRFFGVDGDIRSIGEFIRLYLSRNKRWNSPLFLAGESYGTTRAAGLAGHLIDRGIALNGVMMISTVLNFQTILFNKGNDLPFVLFLPTYTATAWYHKRLGDEYSGNLQKALRDAEAFATKEYTDALAKGDRLTGAEREAVVAKLAKLTGLSKTYVDQSDLRVEIFRFIKELLRDKREVVGRLDSRIKGVDVDAVGVAERSEFDPSMTAIRPPYTAAFNHYVRNDLNYQTDLTYHILGGGIGPWNWGGQNGYADTSEPLRAAFAKNPYMKMFIGYGYYDFATPYFAAQYTLSHMRLPEPARKNITESYYEAGHMFYVHVDSLQKLKKDIDKFIREAIPQASRPTP